MDQNRKAAFLALKAIEKDSSYSNLEIASVIKKLNPDSPAFVRELIYGTLENRLYLDYFLDRIVSRGIKSLNRDILVLLRMGIYQLVFMDSVPEYAAVSEIVNLAKKYFRGRDGFVNGVMRGFIRKKDEIPLPDRKKDNAKYLSVRYSCIPETVKLLIDQYGLQNTEKFLDFANSPAKMNIRVNLTQISLEEAEYKLRQIGFDTARSKLSERVLIVSGGDILESELYKKGEISVQSEESCFIADMMKAAPGETILDVCAAPGGKTCAMAESMSDSGRIIAFDKYEKRVALIEREAKRIGISCIEGVTADSTVYNEAFEKYADGVLVDAPCSGIGVIRRKPEIKYKSFPENGKELADIQYKILCNAADYVRPGGRLVYSTCTVNRIENEDVIQRFTDENKDYLLERKFCLNPWDTETDGFFAALLIRKN